MTPEKGFFYCGNQQLGGNRSGGVVKGTWNKCGCPCRFYAAKALDKRPTDNPIKWERGLMPLSLPPARAGLGRAQKTGQGSRPLRGSRGAEPPWCL